MRAVLKVGRGPLAFACAASSVPLVDHKRRANFSSVECASPHFDRKPGAMRAFLNRSRGSSVVASTDAEASDLKDLAEANVSTEPEKSSILKGTQEVALKRSPLDSTRDFLRSSQLFRDASDELLNTVAAGSDRAFFHRGDMVSEEDVEKQALYIVQDGLLEVRRCESSYVNFIGPGEMVGEIALLSGKRSNCETLKALKPTTAVVLDTSQFANILSEFPKERELIRKIAEEQKEMAVTANV